MHHAQTVAMIAMALLTHTAKGFAEQVGTLPGSSQVSMQAGREGLLLSEVGAVQAVTVTAEGFLVALPPGAMAMAAQGGGRSGRIEKHHIGTIANRKSSVRGGPWTPFFEELFARAGMRLKDAENIVPIRGHKGPHPQRYHEFVFERLQKALGDCRSIVECRGKLTRELRALAEEIATSGTELNSLVTQGR